MSTQLDPVTGLPMYVPPPLEQIPFKNPPYPWKDLTDNPVAPRTTYYGDDSIPTVSTVAGMLPDTPGGETVETDGNHALKVSVVNGGSAGGAAIKPSSYISGYGNTLGSINGSHFGPLRLDRLKKIYIFSASVIYGMSADNGNVEDFVEVGLCDTGNMSTFITFILIGIKHDLTTAGYPLGHHGNDKTVVFPNGLDLTQFFPIGADISFGCGFTNDDFTVAASAVQG